MGTERQSSSIGYCLMAAVLADMHVCAHASMSAIDIKAVFIGTAQSEDLCTCSRKN